MNIEIANVLDAITNEVKSEWSKTHFKWFLKKYRFQKLRRKIARKHYQRLYSAVYDAVTEMLLDQISDCYDSYISGDSTDSAAATNVQEVATEDLYIFENKEGAGES